MAEAFANVAPPVDQEINLDSLAAYLENKFPDRIHADAKTLSELTGELSAAGIKQISQIDHDIERASEAFLLYEKEDPPFGEAGRKFIDVGVVRGVLDLTSDDFREVRVKKRQMPKKDIKRYRDLLR